MNRISATEASRKFSEILNRAKYQGESFLVERNGEPVAEIRPAAGGGTLTGAELLERLRNTPLPDDRFVEDMRDVMAEGRRELPRDRWADDSG